MKFHPSQSIHPAAFIPVAVLLRQAGKTRQCEPVPPQSKSLEQVSQSVIHFFFSFWIKLNESLLLLFLQFESGGKNSVCAPTEINILSWFLCLVTRWFQSEMRELQKLLRFIVFLVSFTQWKMFFSLFVGLSILAGKNVDSLWWKDFAWLLCCHLPPAACYQEEVQQCCPCFFLSLINCLVASFLLSSFSLFCCLLCHDTELRIFSSSQSFCQLQHFSCTRVLVLVKSFGKMNSNHWQFSWKRKKTGARCQGKKCQAGWPQLKNWKF